MNHNKPGCFCDGSCESKERTGETDDQMASGMIKGAIGLLALAGILGFAVHNRNKMRKLR